MVTNNPFYLEAVATYGSSLHTCEDFGFMRVAQAELSNYLIEYQQTSARYGGAIALRGGHGSGKTHLLNWLGRKALELRHDEPSIIYGKADSPSLFDLYKQLSACLEREKIIKLLDLGMKNIAIQRVKTAKVTESIENRIKSTDDLAVLYKESNLDRDEIFNLLERRLQELPIEGSERTEVKGESVSTLKSIVRNLLNVSSSVNGDKAYHWLLGNELEDVETIGLVNNLRQIGEETGGSSSPDTIAIDALEVFATLHRLAEVPFIILIDQLEVLLRTDQTRQEILFSVLKKLIEQISRQHGLLFIAGSDEGWKKLPRDVFPRLRLREPLEVGNLNQIETQALLNSFFSQSAAFSENVAETFHQLSGGSPREIIRIAYHAFEETNGNIKLMKDDLLLKCSQVAGSIEDMRNLALSLTDEILSKYGSLIREFTLSTEISIDRLLKEKGIPHIAIMFVKVTDKLSETDMARKVKSALEILAKEWPEVSLIVVSIGYSSEEVRSLLGQTASMILFSESNFSSHLETEIARISVHKDRNNRDQINPNVLEVLQNISKRLEKIEVFRKKELADTQNRLAEDVRKIAEPERKEREIRTRWELYEEIEELDFTLKDSKNLYEETKKLGNSHFIEKEIIRKILVANETNIKNPYIDQIGGLYLDLLSVMHYSSSSSLLSDSFKIRAEMIREFRKTLRSSTIISDWLRKPAYFSLLFGFIFFFVCTIFLEIESSGSRKTILDNLQWCFTISTGVGIATFINLYFASPLRRWKKKINEFIEYT